MVELLQLDQQKKDLLLMIEGWSPARLTFKPSPKNWSATELFDHLVKVEAGILEAAKRGLAKPHHIGLRDRLGYLFIERVFRSDRKVKVPASATQVLPEINPDLAVVLQRWQQTRDHLAHFYGQLSPTQLHEGIFRHPVSGWMDMPRILGFFSVHMVHHGFQLSRLSAESRRLAIKSAG